MSTEAQAAAKAAALGVPKAYGSVEALAADPAVHVVHVTTPNAQHGQGVRAALAPGKHVLCEKPLAMSSDEALVAVAGGARCRRRPRGDVQLPRQPDGAGGAGDGRRRASLGPVHLRARRLPAGLAARADRLLVAARARAGGPSSAFARHRLALGGPGRSTCIGRRIESVLADLTTVVPVRQSRERRARRSPAATASPTEPFTVRSEDLASVLLRFEGGGKGCVSVGQVCAGHKNDLWFELSGAAGSVRWRQEQQNELWVGKRARRPSVDRAQGSGAAVAARARLCAPAGRTPGGVARRVRECVPRRLSRRLDGAPPADGPRRLGDGDVRRRLPRRVRRGRGAGQPSSGRRVDATRR